MRSVDDALADVDGVRDLGRCWAVVQRDIAGAPIRHCDAVTPRVPINVDGTWTVDCYARVALGGTGLALREPMKNLLPFLLTPFLACTTLDAGVQDAEDDSFLAPAGKGDTGGIAEGTSEALAVLKVVNEADVDSLVTQAGLTSMVSSNIIVYRLGDDELPATADDRRFETLKQLDDIPFVGIEVFGRLVAYAKAKGYLQSRIPEHILNVPLEFKARCRSTWQYQEWVQTSSSCRWSSDCYCASRYRDHAPLNGSVDIVVRKTDTVYTAAIGTPRFADPYPPSPNTEPNPVPRYAAGTTWATTEVALDAVSAKATTFSLPGTGQWTAGELSFRFYGATFDFSGSGVVPRSKDSHGCDRSIHWAVMCTLAP